MRDPCSAGLDLGRLYRRYIDFFADLTKMWSPGRAKTFLFFEVFDSLQLAAFPTSPLKRMELIFEAYGLPSNPLGNALEVHSVCFDLSNVTACQILGSFAAAGFRLPLH